MTNDYTTELKLFYASISLYNFASSIVTIFIPIYLFTKGFSVNLIIIFYAISQVGRLLLLPISAYLSSAFGAKRILGIAFIIEIFYYLFLQRIVYTSHLSLVFILSALLFGVLYAFLWLPYLVHISKISPDENRGKIAAQIRIYSSIVSVAGPLLGGIIIAKYGFSYAFVLAILITIPAIALLLLTPEASKIRGINFSFINVKKIYPDLIANGFFNFQDILNSTVWIIFIFIIVPKYSSIGLIETISLVVSLITLHFIGIWTDKFNRAKLLFWGSISNSLVGVLRILANSFAGVFLFNTASIFTSSLLQIPWNVKLQEHMDQDARTEYMAIFEIGGTLVTLVGLVLFAFLTKSMPLNNILFYGIIAGALAGLGVNLVRK